MTKTIAFSWSLILIAATVDVIAVLVIKNRINFLGPVKFTSILDTINYAVNIIATPKTFLAAVFFFISPILFAFAISRINLSSAYPVAIGITTIALTIGSVIFLSENISHGKILGILTIIFGIFLVYLNN